MKFTELPLCDDLNRGIEKAGFTDCTPVQEQTLSNTLTGRDVNVQSQTGTGKTAAFLITIFQVLSQDEKFHGKKALIIVPTRELAVQIEKEAGILGAFMGLTIGSFYGGVGYVKQEKLLKTGVDVMVGTPGRLIDFQESGKLKLRDVGILVVDEADRLFDMGFMPSLRKIMRNLRPKEERKTMLFSATLNLRVRNLAWKYMNDPVDIEIKPEQMTVEKISQQIFHVGKDKKINLLLGLLKKMKPKSMLIFTNTKRSAYEVSHRLDCNGYQCPYLIGDLPQSKRLRLIDAFKAGECPFLVATDVASRGLHVDELELVVNYDLPSDPEDYVHRIGRTGRIGNEGKAVALACEEFVYNLALIERYIKMEIPVVWVDEELFAEDKSAGKRFRLERKGGGGRGGSGGNRYQGNNRRGGFKGNGSGGRNSSSGSGFSGNRNRSQHRSPGRKP